MIGALTNHVWQSTLFAAAAGLLTVAFRKSRANVRYWLWLSASLKFLVPFSFLMSLGSQLGWVPAARTMATRIALPAVTSTMAQISRPFPDRAPSAPSPRSGRDWTPIAIVGVWTFGFAALARIRFRGWLRIRAAVRASSPLAGIPSPVEVRSSPGLLEPGVVGLLRPVLLLPAGIAERLTPPQLEAVLAHELCHIRRRDNVTAAIHMIVEAVFWFHPLVWWIGSRLVVERERACDEAVLSLGGEPHEYAQGILNVCKLYVESPLACVSGITGPDVKQRVHAILTGRVGGELTLVRKAVLAVAGMVAVAAPIGIGMMNVRPIRAQSPAAATAKFETASISLGCDAGGNDRKGSEPKSGGRSGGPGPATNSSPSPGSLNRCATLEMYIRAYLWPPNAFTQQQRTLITAVSIEGGPEWVRTDRYQINAKAAGNPDREIMGGPMTQALLEDRFKLKIHRELRLVSGYALTVANGGPKMPRFEGTCTPMETLSGPPAPGQTLCGAGSGTTLPNFGTEMNGSTLEDFGTWLYAIADRPVIDRTGLTGRFNFRMYFSPDETAPGALRRLQVMQERHLPIPPADPSAPPFLTALEQQVGLKLEPIQAIRDFLVIDHVDRPSGN